MQKHTKQMEINGFGYTSQWDTPVKKQIKQMDNQNWDIFLTL